MSSWNSELDLFKEQTRPDPSVCAKKVETPACGIITGTTATQRRMSGRLFIIRCRIYIELGYSERDDLKGEARWYKSSHTTVQTLHAKTEYSIQAI